jgi:hypothetical protein
MLADCLRLPLALQQEAKANRDAWQRNSPADRGRPSPSGVNPPSSGVMDAPHPATRETWARSMDPSGIQAVENPPEVAQPREDFGNTAEAENDSGSN